MSAFKATYSDWKLIKTRGVVQVVMEVPLADADAAYTVLGGMPNSAKEQWFGIAPIKPAKEVMPDTPDSTPVEARPEPELNPPARAKRAWRDRLPSNQAGMRSGDVLFKAFLCERDGDDWQASGYDAAECIRMICGVESRTELDLNAQACRIWHQLDEQFQTWKALERAS